MMTDEQFSAAKRAESELKMDHIRKKIALALRNDCIRDSTLYYLPYRALYRLYSVRTDIVPPNIYYPNISASPELQEAYLTLDALEHGSLAATRSRIKRLTSISEQDKAGMIASSEARHKRDPEEVRTQIREMEEHELLQVDQYDYYFTVFLQGEDFSQYRNYDWTGNIIPADEAERLRNGYQTRQKAYRAHPEQFAGYFVKRPERAQDAPPVPEF